MTSTRRGDATQRELRAATRRARVQREDDAEQRALALCAVHLERAAVLLADARRDGQAEPRAARLRRERLVSVGSLTVELDQPLPGDLDDGETISFTCARLDVIGSANAMTSRQKVSR